jgi:hypothetical protein
MDRFFIELEYLLPDTMVCVRAILLIALFSKTNGLFKWQKYDESLSLGTSYTILENVCKYLNGNVTVEYFSYENPLHVMNVGTILKINPSCTARETGNYPDSRGLNRVTLISCMCPDKP